MELKFRDLTADEIELRVGATTEKGFTLLLYKTARVDANLLDETVGVFNWQKKFYQVKNTMLCSVGIKDPDTKEWVWKDDAGDESNTEAIKGEASDSFKRAGFAWGIGRKLYNSPFVWINKSDAENPKTSRYIVKSIKFDKVGVSELTITNEKTGVVVFSYPRNTKVAENGEKAPKKATDDPNQQKGSIRDVEKAVINAYVGKLADEKRKAFFDWLDKTFNTMSIEMLSAEQGIIVARRLTNGK